MIYVALPIAIVTSWFLFQRGMWEKKKKRKKNRERGRGR